MEKDRINRSKEYEILGRILVDFEKLNEALRIKIHDQMYSLGLDFDKGQRPLNILLAKIELSQLSEKFRALYREIFEKEHFLTEQIDLFYVCMKDLGEIRNLLLHATWFMGYNEFSGSEEDISRGFNDRYGKEGLVRKRIYFSEEELTKIDSSIKILIKFLMGFQILPEKEISIYEKVSKEELNDVCLFFKKYKKNIDSL